jgi:hypothetical protein
MNPRAIRAWYRLTCLGVWLAGSLGLAQAASPAAVVRVYVGIVPPAQGSAFAAGLKAWEKCLSDHGSRQRLVTYAAQSGDLGRYMFLEDHEAWAGMDKDDAANTACAPEFRTEVASYLSQGRSEIAVLNAKESYLPEGDPDPAAMLWVEAYRLKPGYGEAFSEAFAKYAAAAAKIHWQAHFGGYDIQGSGKGGEDFVLVSPNKSWADLGADPMPSPKQMMESVYGKAAARAVRGKFEGAIAEEWSDIWSYDKDLSYLPAK